LFWDIFETVALGIIGAWQLIAKIYTLRLDLTGMSKGLGSTPLIFLPFFPYVLIILATVD
jgi:hypothetical protein